MSTRIGIDIGGTFTDLVFLTPEGRVERAKVLSTPEDYSLGIAAGLESTIAAGALRTDAIQQVMHGTTVATNAILEGKGARIALVTTTGFRDILEIRRLRMPVLYDIRWRKPPALVPRRLRFEVAERIDHEGTIERALDEEDARRVIGRVLDAGADAVAVCLLNAYANGAHERRLRELVRERDTAIPVTLSSELLPEIKEYERTSTTVVNAYVLPVVRHYLGRLERQLAARSIARKLTIMQSSGGAMSAAAAAERPIHIIESGPAAGVVGAAELARRLGDLSLLSFDMGGTTAKAALVDRGRFLRVGALEVGGGINVAGRLLSGGGYHVRAPAIDIAEVGAGGGSLVRLDAGGGLKVGPDSAGAAPGPACYGRGGTEPTVTDANVVLGFVNPVALAGGGLPIRRELAASSLDRAVARKLGLATEDAAWGVHRVANATMARALRAVSTERGRDPREFAI
ncbi:MAG: hydantoinase/oxoprolinase family protein, partial [Alphaproteobacteria bacterium]|nr:hydantoinase/oxoprolinase family protein [Alphaproteobacteria bacterium]